MSVLTEGTRLTAEENEGLLLFSEQLQSWDLSHTLPYSSLPRTIFWDKPQLHLEPAWTCMLKCICRAKSLVLRCCGIIRGHGGRAICWECWESCELFNFLCWILVKYPWNTLYKPANSQQITCFHAGLDLIYEWMALKPFRMPWAILLYYLHHCFSIQIP